MTLFHKAIYQNATYPTVSAHVPSHMNLGWHSSFNPQGLMCCWPSRGSQNSLTLLGRLSTSFSSGFIGIFDHSSRSTFVKSDVDVRQEVHARLFHFNSSQRWSNGFEIRTRCRPASFFHTNSLILVFTGLALCQGASTVKQEGPSPNCWEHKKIQNSRVCWGIWISWTKKKTTKFPYQAHPHPTRAWCSELFIKSLGPI